MAQAVSLPIGLALLNARPFGYLPSPVRRYFRPASLALGNVVAVRGFNENDCRYAEGSCYVLQPPPDRDPRYFQRGVNNFAFNGRFLLPGPIRLSLKFSAKVSSVGHLIRGATAFRWFHIGQCPDKCVSDSITGIFAAVVDIEMTLGADLPRLWNQRVGFDALSFLLLPLNLGLRAGRAIMGNYLVGADGKLRTRSVLPLGNFALTPP